MKKLICLLFAISILTACSPNANLKNGDNEIKQTEKEISSIISETEKEEIALVSVAESIEFWSDYVENYTVSIYDWVNDDYFFILLKSKYGENFRYLFWDTRKNKLLDLGEHETELFLANHIFCRDGNFYMISSQNKIMKIELGNFDISYIDFTLPEGYSKKELENIISLSPLGIVAELKDEFTLLLYDVFDPIQKKTIELKEIVSSGIMLNQGVNWSFDGRYFSLFVYEEEKGYHQDRTYTIFNSEGEFIRNVTGGDREIWDNNCVWTWSYEDEERENHYIYSCSVPDSPPIIKNNFFNLKNGFIPRKGVYYKIESNNIDSGCMVIKADLLHDEIKPILKITDGSFNYIPYPSPSGKSIMLLYKDNLFYFYFFNIN